MVKPFVGISKKRGRRIGYRESGNNRRSPLDLQALNVDAAEKIK